MQVKLSLCVISMISVDLFNVFDQYSVDRCEIGERKNHKTSVLPGTKLTSNFIAWHFVHNFASVLWHWFLNLYWHINHNVYCHNCEIKTYFQRLNLCKDKISEILWWGCIPFNNQSRVMQNSHATLVLSTSRILTSILVYLYTLSMLLSIEKI